MICASCRKLLAAEGAAPPHRTLVRIGRTKLRPVLRKPVSVVRYRCGECASNWLLDVDPLNTNESGWTWLGRATSVLEPPVVQTRQP